jgi:hypothetical protein
MKKIVLSMFFAMIGIFANANEQTKSGSYVNITANLNLNTTGGGYGSYDITAYPNSVTYPSSYEVNMYLSVMVTSGQYGKFYYNNYKRRRLWNNSTQTYGAWEPWSTFIPNINVYPNLGPNQLPATIYGGTAKVLQGEGYQIQYYVKVTFIANDGSSVTKDTPTRTATVLGVPTPCFTMPYFVQSTQNEPSNNGQIAVKTICKNGVLISGSCSKFEQGYHIRVAEFDLPTWTFGDDLYNSWIPGSGEAPSYISLNALVAENGKSFQEGKLYIVGFSIGPVWKSAPPQFFRVTNTCRISEIIPQDVKDIVKDDIINLEVEEDIIPTKLEMFPNPVKDNLKILINRDEKIISYTIYDNSGFLVKKKEFKSKLNEQEINLIDLNNGFYIINIETDKGSYRDKIIKE